MKKYDKLFLNCRGKMWSSVSCFNDKSQLYLYFTRAPLPVPREIGIAYRMPDILLFIPPASAFEVDKL